MKKKSINRMYDLYKDSKWSMTPFVILIGGGGVALLVGGFYDLFQRGFSFNTVMFVISSAFVFFLAYVFFLAAQLNPYEWVEKIKQDDPQRLENMERDFEAAEQVLYNVWKGNHYYFFKGPDFFVIPTGQIRSMKITKEYRRRSGSYLRCVIKSDEGMVDFNVLSVIVKKEDALVVLRQLAAESGIEEDIEL